jgi:hypothetical protein
VVKVRWYRADYLIAFLVFALVAAENAGLLVYLYRAIPDDLVVPMSYLQRFLLFIGVCSLFRGGLAQVGWKKNGWARNLLVGLSLFALFSIWSRLWTWLLAHLFPEWQHLFSAFPFRSLRGESRASLLWLLFHDTSWAMLEDTFTVFVFVRLEAFFRSVWLPAILVSLLSVTYHTGADYFLAGDYLSLFFIRLLFLMVFARTRHIGGLVLCHTLYNMTH